MLLHINAAHCIFSLIVDVEKQLSNQTFLWKRRIFQHLKEDLRNKWLSFCYSCTRNNFNLKAFFNIYSNIVIHIYSSKQWFKESTTQKAALKTFDCQAARLNHVILTAFINLKPHKAFASLSAPQLLVLLLRSLPLTWLHSCIGHLVQSHLKSYLC